MNSLFLDIGQLLKKCAMDCSANRVPVKIRFLCNMGALLNELFLRREKQQKSIAVLCDPDTQKSAITQQVQIALNHGVDLFFVGGSHVSQNSTEQCVALLKSLGAPNITLFPGNELHVAKQADAILFMSLISGRNPEYLIAKQVAAAPWVKKSGMEAIPTGYMLVESGKLTSALYISGTLPLPNNKPDIAAATAMAGELLGMQLFYLDAGSGAEYPIPQSIIQAVQKSTHGIVVVGGGIRTPMAAAAAWQNGADIVVLGNGIFENPNLLQAICEQATIVNQSI
jgi:putative glycerol-1-phosphate prenyltransferase